MVIVESLIITTLLVLLFLTSYTDCQKGKIYNKHLLPASIIFIVFDFIYYIFFPDSFSVYAIKNFVLLTGISIALYVLSIWAAGDSKLLMIIGLGIPGRLYSLRYQSETSAVLIIGYAFTFAFLYVVATSIKTGIKQNNLLSFNLRRLNFKQVILSYFMMNGLVQDFAILFTVSKINQNLFRPLAWISLYCLLILGLIIITSRFTTRCKLFITFLAWLVVAYGLYSGLIPWQDISLKIGPLNLIIIVFMVGHMFIDKYNYHIIRTEDIKTGDILAASVMLQFSLSKACGLPNKFTEDLRSRLTESEAESIRQWGKAVYGCSEIMIVRKIPFAVFLAAGTIFFLISGVVKL